MKGDSIREVAFEIDEFEMEHYNEDKKGAWERVYEYLNGVDEQIHELQDIKDSHSNLPKIVSDVGIGLENARCEIDNLEHVGVQNGLVRSKHLHNFLQAARHRDMEDTENHYASDIDYVNVRIPWYLENNLIEKLYLKYHKTRIHRVFDLVNQYIFDEKEEHEDWKGLYVWWGEIKEIWEDEIDDEVTISNHYHDHDTYWEYEVDPKECKNLRDFFRQRMKAKLQEKEEEKKRELERLKTREHKLSRYSTFREYGEKVKGSIYWMIDVNKEYAKDKFGMLYVGASKNFNRRFGAYEVKNKNLNELGKKLKKELPHLSDKAIRHFIMENVKLKVITTKRLADPSYRSEWEKKIITRFKPLLNKQNNETKY